MVGRWDGNDKIGTREGKIVDKDAKKWDELTPSQQEDILFILNKQGFSSLEEFFTSAPKKHTRTYTVVVEKCNETGLFMGNVPGFPAAYAVGDTIEELVQNMREVIELLLEDEEPALEAEFVRTIRIQVRSS